MAKHTGIRKLPNGRFRARYFRGYDSNTGKRVYPARTFDSEREAREWRAAETASKGTSIVEGRGVLLGAFLDHWISTKLNLRDNSLRMYRKTIQIYIKPGLGHVKLSKLSPVHIEAWQSDLLKRVSPTTVAGARTVLYGALKSAKRKTLIRFNPVENTDAPKIIRPNLYALTIEEALKIMAACEGMRSGALFQLLLSCGLRPEESIAVCWSDLDLAPGRRGTLRVNRVIHHSEKGKAWRWHQPKTKSSERVVVFPAALATQLLDHRKAQLQDKLRAGQLWRDNDLVFTNKIGEPITYPTLAHRFKAVVRKAGLSEQISMYTLRHFFVTSSLVAGVDAKTVSREAGHSKPSFTLDRYGHVLDEMHETAASKREHLFSSRSKR